MSLYFSFIEPILMGIMLCILYYNIGTLKLSKKIYGIFLLLMSFASGVLKLLNIEAASAIVNVVIVFFFEYRGHKKIYDAILTSIIYAGAMVLIDMITGFIAMGIFGYSFNQMKTEIMPNIALYVVAILVTLILAKGISIIFAVQKVNLNNIKFNKLLYGYIIITGLVMYLNVTILGNFIEYLSIKVTVLLIVIFSLYFLLGVAFIYMINQNYKKNMELELKEQENERLTGYANLLEKQHDDMRVFKHDYMNMLATMGGYIQLKDMEKLDKFFKEKILNGGEVFKEDENVKVIKKIQSIPVRGMLYAKLVKAQSTKVDLKLTILQDIPLFKMNELDVCKILGILIDNAIEATSESEDKKILITISCEADIIKLTISNSFVGEIDNINLLYHKGYSTKGEGRGLGLHTVKTLLDTKYKSTKLTTSIKENMFVQEILFLAKPEDL